MSKRCKVLTALLLLAGTPLPLLYADSASAYLPASWQQLYWRTEDMWMIREGGRFLLFLFVVMTLERLFSLRSTRTLPRMFIDEFGFLVLRFSTVPIVYLLLGDMVQRAFFSEPWVPAIAQLPFLAQTVFSFLLLEIAYYWHHRMLHAVPWFWRIHQVHHSPQDMNSWSGALRVHFFDMASHFVTVSCPIIALGFSPKVMALCALIAEFNDLFTHSNTAVRYGWLNNWVVTPQVHQFHHSADPPHDRNFGFLFTFWDRLFGTFHMPPNNGFPARLGLSDGYGKGAYPEVGFWAQQMYPLKAIAASIRSRFAVRSGDHAL